MKVWAEVLKVGGLPRTRKKGESRPPLNLVVQSLEEGLVLGAVMGMQACCGERQGLSGEGRGEGEFLEKGSLEMDSVIRL